MSRITKDSWMAAVAGCGSTLNEKDVRISTSIATELFNPASLAGATCLGIVLALIAFASGRAVKFWSSRISHHPYLFIDRTAASFISQLLQLACFLFAAMFYAYLVPQLRQIGQTLLASAGVLSIILGLAAQNTLGNLIAGFALLFYRPFGIGDELVVPAPGGKETGTVKEFSLGYTKLLTADGRWIIAPNSVVFSSVIIRVK